MLDYFCLLCYVETPGKLSGCNCPNTDIDLDLLSPSGAAPCSGSPGVQRELGHSEDPQGLVLLRGSQTLTTVEWTLTGSRESALSALGAQEGGDPLEGWHRMGWTGMRGKMRGEQSPPGAPGTKRVGRGGGAASGGQVYWALGLELPTRGS